ncbi:MAG TPA: TraB/GumN family protein [Allosphingosinicella sp.]|nr:TraB/GumN family protein [Allosphingosinicella sp.]
MLKSIGAAAMAAIAFASAAPAPAQKAAQTRADDRAQVQEIVVTGRRSGVPMWTVRSEHTTLVLIGGIHGISKTTKWDPTALTEALRRADRVMFPQSHALTASPFKAIGWLAKWNSMGSLPKGQSLVAIAGPHTAGRLAALRARGLVQADYDRRHPLHLSSDIRDRAKGDIEYGRNVADYVARAVKKYKLVEVVPIHRSKAKPVIKDLFASTPQEHLPCLQGAIMLAEAGPAAIQARSDAWAARRIPEVLASPADAVYGRCWPSGVFAEHDSELLPQMKRLLAEPQVTMAVLSLRTLADRGGILDGLEAAGFDIQGPAWK